MATVTLTCPQSTPPSLLPRRISPKASSEEVWRAQALACRDMARWLRKCPWPADLAAGALIRQWIWALAEDVVDSCGQCLLGSPSNKSSTEQAAGHLTTAAWILRWAPCWALPPSPRAPVAGWAPAVEVRRPQELQRLPYPSSSGSRASTRRQCSIWPFGEPILDSA